jgi:hypothetical protein
MYFKIFPGRWSRQTLSQRTAIGERTQNNLNVEHLCAKVIRLAGRLFTFETG